jgi:hypothetical protein
MYGASLCLNGLIHLHQESALAGALSSFPETLSTPYHLFYDSIHRLALRYIAKDAVAITGRQATEFAVSVVGLRGTAVFFQVPEDE